MHHQADSALVPRRRVLFEVGCGVGNFFYPLLQDGLDFQVHACDLSPRAVQFVKVGRVAGICPVSTVLKTANRCYRKVEETTPLYNKVVSSAFI